MVKENNTNKKRTRNTAARRLSQRRKSRRHNDNRGMIALIIGVVAVFSTVLIININGSFATLKELKEEESKLIEKREEQRRLAEELKEKEVYVKTNAYIEEQARKMGLVYPNEVIFKPED